MAPSQLKQLKSSLREQGVVGPKISKKQKKRAVKDGRVEDGRFRRTTAIQHIRDQFNPFEIRAPPRAVKHETVNSTPLGNKAAGVSITRPGIARSIGEETRRRTLLVDMQRRRKVGGIVDRRFGENNPRMTLEEKAVERFVKINQHGNKRESMFDLEEAEGSNQLTHFGKSIVFDTSKEYDYISDIGLNDHNSKQPYLEETGRSAKRRRISETEGSDKETFSHESQSNLEHSKSKREVLSEVIAKSKLHKHERQQAKEGDDDLRAKLDEGLPDLLAFIRQTPVQVPQPRAQEMSNGSMNPDRAALLNGKDRLQADREYDEHLRQMAFDQRSKPTERTMNEAEKADRETQKLKELEEERLRRMKGEQDSEEEEEEQEESDTEDYLENMHGKQNGSKLSDTAPSANNIRQSRQLEVEDEDEFLIEDSSLASQSYVGGDDSLPMNGSDEYSRGSGQTMLIEGNMGTVEFADHELHHNRESYDPGYTYECPQNHAELLKVTLNVPPSELPVVIQRIRALYHPQLNASNKKKLGVFSTVLVEHVAYLADQCLKPPLFILEALIRHIHSLAKVFPEEVGGAIRVRLKLIHETRATTPTAGDLVILTAISAIFSTSDQFHQVGTPAMLYMGFYLNQKVPQTLSDLAVGTYLSTLFLEYQRLSKRYIPELVNYTVNCLSSLLPLKTPEIPNSWHQRNLPATFKLQRDSGATSRLLRFWDILHPPDATYVLNEELKLALIDSQVVLSSAMAEMWTDKSAFPEILEPVATCLSYMASTCKAKLPDPLNEKIHNAATQVRTLLQQARIVRKPLLLHNHRPLPIKTFVPKFEESFNPDKHYDPDRERSELHKLKAEHKKERKGAMRELRKDANFIARETLREKKEKDAQYEKKYKRLIAEIQGEEGKEANEYKREKRLRKGKR